MLTSTLSVRPFLFFHKYTAWLPPPMMRVWTAVHGPPWLVALTILVNVTKPSYLTTSWRLPNLQFGPRLSLVLSSWTSFEN